MLIHSITGFFAQFSILELSLVILLLLFLAGLTYFAVYNSYLAEKYKKRLEAVELESKRFHKLKNTYAAELKTFADLLDEINFPIWQRDKNLKIVYCNARFCEITGSIRDEILQQGDVELFRGSSSMASKAMKAGQTQVTEQNIIISGSNTLNQVVEIPVTDRSYGFSSKTGTIGFALNFTELQAVRERLKLSVELQKRLLESLNNAVAIYNANKRLEYFNEAFVDLWKFDEEWLKKGPSYSEILEVLREKRKLPEQVDFVNFKRENDAMFSNLLNKKEDYYYLPDGTVLKVIIIPYEQRGLLMYYENVTEAINLEGKYNTLLSVQKQTIDNLNEAVALFGEDGRLKLYNPSYSEIWGHTKSLLNSEPHIRELLEEEKYLYPYDDWETFKDSFVLLMQSREVNENKLNRNDGIVLLQRTTPLSNGATLLTYFDITDKENVEKSLRAEKRAYEEADRIKTNFLGNVSYELRSPLTSIMGFTEILMMEYYDKVSVKSKEYLKAIFDSSVRLKNLIDNIIEVSSIEAGYVNITRNNFSLKDALSEIIPYIEKEAERKNIKLNYRLPTGTLYITADKDRLMQVIKTVMTNSFIASYERLPEVSFNVDVQPNYIRFEVHDNARTIPKEDLPLVFDQFYKAHSDSISINGIGLYLSKRIIEMHGGFIMAESEEDGNKFTFEIPNKRV